MVIVTTAQAAGDSGQTRDTVFRIFLCSPPHLSNWGLVKIH
jgi:hypothetical protein